MVCIAVTTAEVLCARSLDSYVNFVVYECMYGFLHTFYSCSLLRLVDCINLIKSQVAPINAVSIEFLLLNRLSKLNSVG